MPLVLAASLCGRAAPRLGYDRVQHRGSPECRADLVSDDLVQRPLSGTIVRRHLDGLERPIGFEEERQ